MKFSSNRFLNITIIVTVSLILLFLVIYKASITSFTHDESYTYLHYVHRKFLHILSYKDPYTNNHILNSICIKYSEMILGSSELALRLPNIAAFVLYLFFAYRFLKDQKQILILPLFLILVLNPYLLDFFGLARGYGLSIGLLMVSLYYLIDFFNNGEKNISLAIFNLAALLSVLANFTMLNYYLAALITFNIVLFFKHVQGDKNSRINIIRDNKVNLISIVVSGIVLFEPIRRLAKTSILDYGSKNILQTFQSQIYNMCYNSGIYDIIRDIFTWIILFIITVSFLLLIYNLARKNKTFISENRGLLIVNSILLIITMEMTVQHFLLGNDYFKDRFALFLYPIIILNSSYLFFYFLKTRFKIIVVCFCYLIIPILVFSFLINFRFDSYRDWKYDMNTKKMLVFLDKQEDRFCNENGKTQIGIEWLFEPTINFYRETLNLNWLMPVTRDGLSENDNYYYLLDTEYQTNDELIISYDITGLNTKTSLFKKNKSTMN